MVNSASQGPHRGLSGVDPPGETTMAEEVLAAVQAQGTERLRPSSADRHPGIFFAFVSFAAIVYAFVFGLLVCTRLEPSQVLQITGGATAIIVAGFFGRNAMIVIGRRMITGPGKQ
jgi:hypothetical protein